MALTGNKGEWSEIYVLLKLLGDKKVYAGDGDLNKLEDLFYPILKVLRNEHGNSYEYTINDNIVIVTEDGNELLRKNVVEFLDRSKELLTVIRSSKGTFSSPEIEKFMSEIHCNTLKAKSQDKTDIRIVIHDLRTGMTPKLGFSIKSQVGNDSTLLNPGKTTVFCYQLVAQNVTDEEIAAINAINTRKKILDRTDAVLKLGKLQFYCMEDSVFKNNLVLIDSYLPEIIADILLQCYSTKVFDLKKIVEKVAKNNPMKYDTSNNHSYYEHKIKNLLVASALGMVPHTPWNGQYDANGGYLVVKEDGDVLCYHFYDRNRFEDYLFGNTRLDTPSSSRYGTALLYRGEDGSLFYRLNLQIRFK